jgi:translation initiation factor IF-2
MKKIRISEIKKRLSEEVRLNLGWKEIVSELQLLGYEVKESASASVEENAYPKLLKYLEETGQIPREEPEPVKPSEPPAPAVIPAVEKPAEKATVTSPPIEPPQKPHPPSTQAQKIAEKPKKPEKAVTPPKLRPAEAPKKPPVTIKPPVAAQPSPPIKETTEPKASGEGSREKTVTPALETEAPQKSSLEEELHETPLTPGPELAEPEVEELKVPDRFRKDMESERIEKLKTKPAIQRAFQAVRKIEPKKWHDLKYHKKPEPGKKQKAEVIEEQVSAITAPRKKSLKLQEGITVKEFAELIGIKLPEVIKKFMEMGYMATANQPVDIDAAQLLADSYGIKVEIVGVEEEPSFEEGPVDEAKLQPRPPVVTIMGHVDHGKTSLLDAIRETKVAEKEAGGITQHIGAYKVNLKGKDIVFLDTPGHEAFTTLRARGAKVTDVVVLVVAADDGVMPQTVEAINHARAANVPIVVAINKIDKPEANPAKVKNELAEYNIIPEEWGGQNIFVEVSAKKRIGIENLLEMILLQAEVLDLKADPLRPARGTIIEARLDRTRGPVATVLIQSGTLKVGDVFIAGTTFGRVRALIDDTGKKIDKAGPSTPVEVTGFTELPQAGDTFVVMEDERKARQIALVRQQKLRAQEIAKKAKLTLDGLYTQIQEGQLKELNIIIKADTQGSVEAIKKAVEAITHPEVKVKVLHAAVGGINESDVLLAAASNAIIIGFNVRPEMKAAQTAEREGVDIRLYNIIYDAVEEVKRALEGMLAPTLKEKVLGRAEVRQLFHISKVGTVAGCYVVDGIISRTSDGIRVIRDNIVVYDGKIASLKRFKEDVREVQSGYECGILIENFNDIKVGDILENYIIEKIAAKLD